MLSGKYKASINLVSWKSSSLFRVPILLYIHFSSSIFYRLLSFCIPLHVAFIWNIWQDSVNFGPYDIRDFIYSVLFAHLFLYALFLHGTIVSSPDTILLHVKQRFERPTSYYVQLQLPGSIRTNILTSEISFFFTFRFFSSVRFYVSRTSNKFSAASMLYRVRQLNISYLLYLCSSPTALQLKPAYKNIPQFIL